jgi:membrane protein DedA with SNARE-associated domain
MYGFISLMDNPLISSIELIPTPLELKDNNNVQQNQQPFFARHGGKAVFLARWTSGLRVAGAWVAGMSRMPWPRFLLWNALGVSRGPRR